MPAPIIVPLLIKGVCACFGIFVCKKGIDAYDKNSERNHTIKIKSLDEAREDNKKAREEEKKTREALEEQEKKNREMKEELEQAKRKANDSSLSEEERAQWRRKVVTLEENLSNGEFESKNLTDTLKKIGDRIKNNNKIISGIGLNTTDKHWIKEFLTLENVLIVAGCYVLWQLAKEEKR